MHCEAGQRRESGLHLEPEEETRHCQAGQRRESGLETRHCEAGQRREAGLQREPEEETRHCQAGQMMQAAQQREAARRTKLKNAGNEEAGQQELEASNDLMVHQTNPRSCVWQPQQREPGRARCHQHVLPWQKVLSHYQTYTPSLSMCRLGSTASTTFANLKAIPLHGVQKLTGGP